MQTSGERAALYLQKAWTKHPHEEPPGPQLPGMGQSVDHVPEEGLKLLGEKDRLAELAQGFISF